MGWLACHSAPPSRCGRHLDVVTGRLPCAAVPFGVEVLFDLECGEQRLKLSRPSGPSRHLAHPAIPMDAPNDAP